MFRTRKELTEAFQQLTALCLADAYATGKVGSQGMEQGSFQKVLADILQSMPVHTSELEFKGITAFQGDEQKLIGTCLKQLLRRVQDGELANNNETLTAAAQKWLGKIRTSTM